MVLGKAVQPIIPISPAIIAKHTAGEHIDMVSVRISFKAANQMLKDKAVQMLRDNKVPFVSKDVARQI